MAEENGHDEEDEVKVPMMTERGMPLMTEEEVEKGQSGTCKMLVVISLVPRVLGAGFAALIYFFAGKETFDMRIAKLNGASWTGDTMASSFELGYLYFAIAFMNFVVAHLNNYPMYYKSAVMPGNAGNLRANMLIYKVNSMEEGKTYPYVVMEEEGEIGEYNRANRALHHFVENGTALVLCIVASGAIFSLPVFILTILYGFFRMLYQYKYAEGGYGFQGHALPFMFHSVLIAPVFEMLTWLAGAKFFLITQAEATAFATA